TLALTSAFNNNSYVKQRGDDGPIDVVRDEANIEDPVSSRDADSDQQLAKDEKEAIDQSNVIKSRLRGNEPRRGAMAEPSDEKMGLME
ncbi:hypothetical protein CHU98_g9331, partial [Xylaria longipes]